MAATEIRSSSLGKTNRFDRTLEKPKTSRKRLCSRPCLFTVSAAKASSATPGTRGHYPKCLKTILKKVQIYTGFPTPFGGSLDIFQRQPFILGCLHFVSNSAPHSLPRPARSLSFSVPFRQWKADLGLHRSEPIQGINAVHLRSLNRWASGCIFSGGTSNC